MGGGRLRDSSGRNRKGSAFRREIMVTPFPLEAWSQTTTGLRNQLSPPPLRAGLKATAQSFQQPVSRCFVPFPSQTLIPIDHLVPGAQEEDPRGEESYESTSTPRRLCFLAHIPPGLMENEDSALTCCPRPATGVATDSSERS